mmetsp:Transcript_74061/g.130918  ORF Transcript_74061/g.130918 Transcript_74061/m.130918 type:complete len:962 (-) Transcript_74061:48-2933(-)
MIDDTHTHTCSSSLLQAKALSDNRKFNSESNSAEVKSKFSSPILGGPLAHLDRPSSILAPSISESYDWPLWNLDVQVVEISPAYWVLSLVLCFAFRKRVWTTPATATSARGAEDVFEDSADPAQEPVQEFHSTGPSQPPIPEQPFHDLLLSRYKDVSRPALWLEGDAEAVTYAQLLAAARNLALHLLRMPWSVSSPSFVPLLMRSCDGYEILVGSIGSMMSGVGFAPADVEKLPADRLKYIVKELNAPVALASLGSQQIAEQMAPGMVIAVTRAGLSPEGSGELPQVDISAPMALFWTSGSTGNPKGVVVPFRAALSHYVYYLKEFQITEEARCLRTGAIGFDMTFSVVFGALLHGACVVWPVSDILREPSAMERVCSDYSVNLLVTVPTVISSFLETRAFPQTVQHVGSGGEPLSWSLVEKLSEAQIAIHNRCGPTECGNIALLKSNIDARSPRYGNTVPVGKPCAHRTLHVLPHPDCKTGGELWLSGPGLADGYFARPDLTSAVFKEICYEGGCVRAYQTGDLVKWTPEKELMFLGRADCQVKLRGQRVELGEIEGVLKSYPAVTEAVVMLDTGAQSLCAIVSPASVDLPEVLAFAKMKLPSHMVPQVCHALSHWPRNSNNKVDRKALEKILASQAHETIHVENSLYGEEQDSFGAMRAQSKKQSQVEIDFLWNLRFILALGVLQEHYRLANEYYLTQGSCTESVLCQFWWAAIQSDNNHTDKLVLIAGYLDSFGYNKFTLNFRDRAGLLLTCIWIVAPWAGAGWFLPYFMSARLVSVFGGRFRLLGYSIWFFVAWYLLPGCDLGVGSATSAAANIGLAYWFGLECGRWLQLVVQGVISHRRLLLGIVVAAELAIISWFTVLRAHGYEVYYVRYSFMLLQIAIALNLPKLDVPAAIAPLMFSNNIIYGLRVIPNDGSSPADGPWIWALRDVLVPMSSYYLIGSLAEMAVFGSRLRVSNF